MLVTINAFIQAAEDKVVEVLETLSKQGGKTNEVGSIGSVTYKSGIKCPLVLIVAVNVEVSLLEELIDTKMIVAYVNADEFDFDFAKLVDA